MTLLKTSSYAMLSGLVACTPVTLPVSHQYQLDRFETQHHAPLKRSILVSQPEALAGFQTEQIMYQCKPHELSAFAHNAWSSTPSNMLFPLIVQSLEQSHAFFAVTGSADADSTDYRLDTQLITLQQNFIPKPSVLEWQVHVVLTHVEDHRVVASRTFRQRIPCPTDTPYGGVLAANQATQRFTSSLTHFVIHQIQSDPIK